MRIEHTTPKGAALVELGQRLARVRKHRGLTQAQLAKEAGLGLATLQRIEDGKDAQMGSWFKLLKALDATDTIDSLLPASIDSPLLEVKKARRGARKQSNPSPLWGDEQA